VCQIIAPQATVNTIKKPIAARFIVIEIILNLSAVLKIRDLSRIRDAAAYRKVVF
jgi:hypothetical protein